MSIAYSINFKTLIALILVFSSVGDSLAQDDPSLLGGPALQQYLNSDDCNVPGILKQAVIHYENETVLFIQFSEQINDASLSASSKNGDVYIPLYSDSRLTDTENAYLVRNLPTEKNLVLSMRNSCNDLENTLVVNTSTEPLSGGIEVSNELYSLITRFQRDSKDGSVTPFCEVLEAAEDVHFFEKVYFIQNYYSKGQKLDEKLIRYYRYVQVQATQEVQNAFVNSY